MLKALTISGSSRRGSSNHRLALHVGQLLSEHGVDVEDLDLAALNLPIFNEDLEDKHMPDVAVALGAKFLEADIIFIACPEYNGSVTPLLKNALDWVSRQKGRPYRRAVFGIGAASSGKLSGVMALSHLRDILTKLLALTAPVDVRIGPAREAFDADGALIDAAVLKRATLLADDLMALASRAK